MSHLLDIKIFWKIFLALVFVGLLSTLSVSVVTYILVEKNIEEEAFDKLTAIREVKGAEVEQEFAEIRKQVASFAEDFMVVDAMEEFSQAFAEVEKEAQGNPAAVTEARENLQQFQERKFLPLLNANAESIYHAEDITPANPGALLLQDRYIVRNPNPIGSKQFFDRAHDNTPYNAVHGRYHPLFRSYQEKFGYYDIFLVEPDSGNIVYSVSKELDFATSLHEAVNLPTNFGQVFKRAAATDEKDFQLLVDFQNYWASFDTPASFIAAPIFEGERKIGVLVFQMPITRINDIMTNRGKWQEAGMGSTGEIYLVGRDHKLRSQSRFFMESKEAYLKALRLSNMVSDFICDKIKNLNTTIGLQPVETSGVKRALKGESGQGIFNDYRGHEVLSAFRPLNILNVDWVILSEMDHAEAFAALKKMRVMILWSFIGLLVLISIFARFVSKFIAEPLVGLSALMAKVESSGDLALRLDNYNQDEVGKTVRNFHTLLRRWSQTLRDVQGNTKLLLTEGRWSTDAEVTPLTENDFLGTALSEMSTALRSYHFENSTKSWLDTGQGGLNDRMRGEQSPHDLAQSVLQFLAHYLDAQMGMFYGASEEGVSLLASYALPDRENMVTSFGPGEGVVGQVILEKNVVLLTFVDEDYPPVQTGLAESAPKNIMVVPLVFNDQVQGAIEFSTLAEFTPLHIDFMKQSAESIAIALAVSKSRIRNMELLEQTRMQTEELQSQTEELQNQTEELQNQTEELEAQQEQLKMVNSELEERAELLETQKQEIMEKSLKAEEAKHLIEIKAAELEESNRYKSEFLANMSHELRTPMNSIMVLSQTLVESAPGIIPEKQKGYLQTIHDSGAGLLTIINDILDMSKMQAGKIEAHIEEVDLQEIGAEMELMFRPLAAQKGLELEIDVAQDLPTLYSDRQRLVQIVRNFLGNAVKFTEKGLVRLLVGQPGAARELYGRTYLPQDLLAFVVEDSGIGIPLDKQDQIFDAFQQQDGSTSRIYGGTGLGLTISREFTKLLGGHLELESSQGKGSVFTLILPLKKSGQVMAPSIDKVAMAAAAEVVSVIPGDPAHAPEKGGEKSDTVRPVEEVVEKKVEGEESGAIWQELEGKTLLVADDDPRNIYSLAALTEPVGLELIVAENGKEALARLQEVDKIDAILMDIMMPEMDGYETMKQIRKMPAFRDIPIIVLTAKVMPEEREHCLAAGASDYLAKPVVRERLFNMLKVWLHDR